MNVLIVEDEINAFEYLQTILLSIDSDIKILDNLDSVQATLNYLQNQQDQVDLIFLDIQLSDGLSFEIFNHIDIDIPIIFTTAYDQYALDAFKVHSIDYLLKPIHKDELKAAVVKYKKLYAQEDSRVNTSQFNSFLENLQKRKKNRCLVKRGGHYEYVDVNNIAYVNSADSMTFLHTDDGQRHIYSKPVESLYQELDPERFFQISRSQIVHINSVKEIHPYLNQRLKVLLNKPVKDNLEFVVSRNRITEFKNWLDQ